VSARLFPVPEADLTLLVRAPTAEDLLPPAQELLGSGLPFAAVELLDPLFRLPGGERSAGVPSPVAPSATVGKPQGAGLAFRVLGSRAEVEEVETRVRKELGPCLRGNSGEILSLRGPDSVSFQDAHGRWEEDCGLVLRLSLLPSRMSELLGEARALEGEFGRLGEGGGSPEGGRWGRPHLSAHVGSGVLRLAFRPGNGPVKVAPVAVKALRDLRRLLEGSGGSLTVSRGPASLLEDLGAWGAVGADLRIMKGLKAEFDPAGILSPGRFGF
jgi:FAD/FMN-containing dehydrogenase